MAIPKDYETLMHRVFNEPAIMNIVEEQKWKVITFEALRMFYNKTKNDRTINLDDFDKLARKPREHIKNQPVITEF